VASSYSNIGVVYRKKGQYERALEYYQKAFEIDIKVSGQDHPDVATSKYNIANLKETQGDLEGARMMI
jgi:tetratricopeptide (TPR) repeat protein